MVAVLIAVFVASCFMIRYAFRASAEGRPGWGVPKEDGVRCPHAVGERGKPGEPGKPPHTGNPNGC